MSRILRKLCGEGYELVSPEYEGWAAAGGTPSSFSVDFEPEGKIYWWFTSEGMERALQSAGLQPAEFKWLLVVRDPRDVGVSLFHLAQDTGHMELARASATVYETHLRLAEEARSIGVDRYALDRASPGAEGLQRLQRLCERVPPHHVAFLSYALLCEEFPEFLKRLLAFAPFQPSPEQVEHLLETEDIRRPERLHATSLARAVMASPKPGRFRRELRPETIAEMNHRTAEARAWLASMEEPHLRHVYGD